jgi:hypothetical protein
MIESADPAMAQLMQAQVMDVILFVEYAIQRSVNNARFLNNDDIERINSLEIEFAILVGRSDPAEFIFPDESDLPSRVRNILSRIDQITGGEVAGEFDSRLREVRALLTGGLVESLHTALEFVVASRPDVEVPLPVEEAPTSTPEEIAAERSLERMTGFLNRWVDRLPRRTIGVVEGSRETIYELLHLSLESSEFNIVLMSDAPDPTRRRPLVAIDREPTLRHPDLREISESSEEIIRQRQAFSEAHLENAIVSTPDGSVLITQSTLDEWTTLVTMLGNLTDGRYMVRHYLLPGSTTEQLVSVTQTIGELDGVEEIEATLLYRWAIVAQTALEL